MTNASQLAFIRTQAETFAWAAVAADSLVAMGVIFADDALGVRHVARELIAAARTDPKFIGDKLPAEFK